MHALAAVSGRCMAMYLVPGRCTVSLGMLACCIGLETRGFFGGEGCGRTFSFVDLLIC